MEKELLHPLTPLLHGTRSCYGGDQALLRHAYVQNVGCGVIGCGNVLLHLARYSGGCRKGPFSALADSAPVSHRDFTECCEILRRRFLPLIPHFGISGPLLVLGLNGYFRRWRLPYRASWGTGSRQLWPRIAAMLDHDIPVILSIGPNLPAFWGRARLKLYEKRPDGSMHAAVRTKAHYVTVTGMDAHCLRVSSWGRVYYIDRAEYAEYVKKHSCFLVSNAVFIRRTKK